MKKERLGAAYLLPSANKVWCKVMFLHISVYRGVSASRRICLRGGLPTAGSAYSGVCLQGGLPPRGSASLRSSSRSLCLLRGSTSRGSTSSGVCLQGGSASQAVCLQGGFTDPQTRKAGSTHPTGMIFFYNYVFIYCH